MERNEKQQRPPIVAILGHVDHGKSTLLDYIRKANTVASEAGGITQHVAAYEVTHTDATGTPRRITFIDTPGHAAFGAIRARSTNLADIAILIVSAEDGVKPQTSEAIRLLKDRGIPFVVALNKVDSQKANVERAIASLAEEEIFLEGRGGNVPSAQISAKTGLGVGDLLELILLVAELEDLTADANAPAQGSIVEAHRDPRRGVSATLIITNGTLSVGDFLASDGSFAPVRTLETSLGEKITKATFSASVRTIGWSALPQVGASFVSCASKREAEHYAQTHTQTPLVSAASVEEESAEHVVLPVIIKADVSGTLDAIKHELEQIENDRVTIKILRADVGHISENDIKAAGRDERAVALGFNVKVDPEAKELAERGGITIQTFDIIYKLTDWLKELVVTRRPRVRTEAVGGTVKILKTFAATKHKQVVGGKVTVGEISVGNKVTIRRRGEAIGTGTISGLQAQKQNTKVVTEGSECGIQIAPSVEIAPGDELDAIVFVES